MFFVRLLVCFLRKMRSRPLAGGCKPVTPIPTLTQGAGEAGREAAGPLGVLAGGQFW